MTEEGPPVVFRARELSITMPLGPALQALELEVRRGEAVGLCVLGQADAGLLMNVLAGLERPAAGELEWNGITSRALAAAEPAERYKLEREQRLSTSYLTAAAALMTNLSLFDNIALPLRYHGRLPDEDVAARVGALVDELKLKAEIHQRPSGLPRGVRRRAQVARALVLEPPLLLVDAPSLEIDPLSVETITAVLGRRRRERGLTLIASADEPAQILPLVTRLLVIYDGKLLGSLEGQELQERDRFTDTTRFLKSFSSKEPDGCAPP